MPCCIQQGWRLGKDALGNSERAKGGNNMDEQMKQEYQEYVY